jgi:hypothetical protein
VHSEFFIPALPGQIPSAEGYFGAFGGKFIPEALVAAVDEVAVEYERAKADPAFVAELEELLVHYAGRPSALTEVPRFAGHAGGARVFLKREDLNHTGSHKVNNVLGQALLTKRMGKPRVVAETGAGSHGVATATACALFGLECTVYMGEIDTHRQALNAARMKMLGHGRRTHPFPAMIRDFQRVIGVEARRCPRASPASFMVRALTCCRTRRARSPSSARSRPGSAIRASGPGTRTCTTSAAASTARSPTTPRCRRSGCSRRPWHHPGDRERPRARRRPRRRHRARPGRADPREPVRSWRQGHGHCRPLFRSLR